MMKIVRDLCITITGLTTTDAITTTLKLSKGILWGFHCEHSHSEFTVAIPVGVKVAAFVCNPVTVCIV